MAEIHNLGSWRQNAKRRFSRKLTNLELWSLLTTYRMSYMGFSKNQLLNPLKSKMAEFRHSENRHDVIFCRGRSDLDKISQTGAEWHLDCGDMDAIAGVCLSVCLLARLLKNAWMDLDEMLRVDRCRDIEELVNFWARSGSQSGCRNRITFSDVVCTATRGILLRRENPTYRYWAWLFAARRSSDTWFWGVERPLSEVNALYRVRSSYTLWVKKYWTLFHLSITFANTVRF